MKSSHILLFGLSVLLMFVPSCATTSGSHEPRVGLSRFSSKAHIRDKLLKYTPIGSSYGQVQEFVRCRLEYRGAPDYENSPAIRVLRPGVYQDVGVRRIDIWLGAYGFPGYPMAISTQVSWAFDKNDTLLDVVVRKWRESL